MELLHQGLATRSDVQADHTVRTKQGTTVTLLTTASSLTGTDGRPRRVVFALDITARREAERVLEQRAHYDLLTGLPNRLLFRTVLEQAMAQARRTTQRLAV